MTLIPIDGPSLYTNLSVGTSPVEVKVGASRLSERKAIAVQALSDSIYIGFDNSVTTSNGVKLQIEQLFIFEAGESMPVWVVSPSAANDVRIWELG